MESKPTICIPICEQTMAGMAAALTVSAPLADVFELRLDCLDQASPNESQSSLTNLVVNSSKPTILTFRPSGEGGFQELSDDHRLAFWRVNRFGKDTYLDLELDLVRNPASFDAANTLDWTRIICSHHDFNGVASDLESLYQGMAGTQARILKIAVKADDAIDCLPIFRLLERAQRDKRELIAIAMGEAGLMTRILGPSRGSFLTYAARDNEKATAPGQLTARDLRDVYRIDKIDLQTEIFGVVGLPVSHSLSPGIHNAAFESIGGNAVFIPFEVRDLPAFIHRMVHQKTREIEWNLRGLSVTAPHKQAVTNFLDRIDPAAREVGAVNTVLVNHDGLSGYNTDVTGFIQPLLEAFGNMNGLRCAVIGTGGAASAGVWALKSRGAEVTVFGRTPDKLALFVKRFDVNSGAVETANFDGFDVVVNATPLGTSGKHQSETAVSTNQLRGAHLAYDLVYNPSETEFLRQAQTAGCETLGGTEMFLAQAAEQFRIWTGNDAPSAVMRNAFKQALKIDD